jgi:FkbM family methyltransferase
MKIIYDLGANNGDDIPYYLLKADTVVAVEANPSLCELIHKRFPSEIAAGRLIVENCAVAAEGESGPVDFYIHKKNHVLSQLPEPEPERAALFDKVPLQARTIADIISSHGDPYYVKIDLERYDTPILRALFRDGIIPPFLSAEAHSLDVFALMVVQGGYNAFKLVNGFTVSMVYSRRWITDTHGRRVKYSFPFHSAGPFGNDVDGEWMTADKFLGVLAHAGLGWRDIHATTIEPADPLASQRVRDYLLRLPKSFYSTIAARLKDKFTRRRNELPSRNIL